MTDLTLYDYAASANCLKARVLLAQLGRPYRRVGVDIFAGDTAAPEYRRRNPLARTPVLELADGTAIAESGAILLYLAEGTACCRPIRWRGRTCTSGCSSSRTTSSPTSAARASGASPGATSSRPRSTPTAWRAARPRSTGSRPISRAARGWPATAYTIADLALWAYVHLAPDVGVDLDARPAVSAWIERVQATPGFVDDLEPYPENALPGRGSRPER